MPGKSDAFETALLSHIFLNTAIANIGDATGLPASATPGNLFVALYTADPGEAGTATTSETTYTGYARVAVARSAAGFTVTGNKVELVSAATFPECTAGTATITHWGIVNTASGAGTLLYSGPLTPNINVQTGVSPIVKGGAGQTSITED